MPYTKKGRCVLLEEEGGESRGSKELAFKKEQSGRLGPVSQGSQETTGPGGWELFALGDR